MLSLNLPLPPGTWETCRGREGGARSARPDARERGFSTSRPDGLSRFAEASNFLPQNSRSRDWKGGARRVRGSRTGQSDCLDSRKQPTGIGSRGCLALERMRDWVGVYEIFLRGGWWNACGLAGWLVLRGAFRMGCAAGMWFYTHIGFPFASARALAFSLRDLCEWSSMRHS